jgi:catechol 2,3-dioxygenase-like lactoylglutathione lyase family enzyme
MMRLQHIALVSSSESKSDRFYQDVLGLEKKESKILSSELSKKIFGISRNCKIVNYGNHEIQFEIFISEKGRPKNKTMDHICLDVYDRNLFIQQCNRMKIEVNQIPRGESMLVFIKDYDGNLFEIKEKK